MNDRSRIDVSVLDAANAPLLPLVEGDGEARAVVWPGVGARRRSLHVIRLGAGAATVVQRHPADAVYYVVSGELTVGDPDDGSSHDLTEGSMVHIDAGTAYRFRAGDYGAELLGGPCPPDPALYASLEE